MTATGDIWPAAAWPPGWHVRHVPETGSTNADLLAAAAAGSVPTRSALVADHQTAGRGRLDRRWDAPPAANLLVSLLLPGVAANPVEPMQRVALAACHAVDRLVPTRPLGIKWPNDLVHDDRKVAGMLAERVADPVADRVVVGLGCNVSWSPDGAADLGGAVSPAELLATLLAEFDALPREIGASYRGRLVTIGRRVRATLPAGGALVGVAEDVDDAGRLVVVEDSGARHVLDVGDIVHLRPADA